MRTAIDRAGRVVIPKPLRDELGLPDGGPVEISLREGRVEIEPATRSTDLVERDGFLAAELLDDDQPALTAEEVRAVLERVRR